MKSNKLDSTSCVIPLLHQLNMMYIVGIDIISGEIFRLSGFVRDDIGKLIYNTYLRSSVDDKKNLKLTSYFRKTYFVERVNNKLLLSRYRKFKKCKFDIKL